MGLGFTFRAKIREIKTFQQIVDKLAVESGYSAEHDKSSSTVNFCKLGDLFLIYEQKEDEHAGNSIIVNGECQTNMLGAGFHKAAIEFVDKLQKEIDTPLEVEDETDYYAERDFEGMKRCHFHKWLTKLFEVIHTQEEKGSTALSICWDIHQYIPKSEKGVVISPFGSFRISDVTGRIKNEGIDSFANDFFIWNNPEQDARFHRGLALHALWEDCYFMPSRRSEEDSQINEYIIKELEKAASLDPSLPFPKNEYELLCRLHGHTPVSTEGIPSYETEFTIGYRRSPVTYKIGNIKFDLSGSYLKDIDEGTVIYYDNAAENWYTVRCTAYSMEGEPDYLDVKEEIIAEGKFEGGKYRLYDMGMERDSDDEEPYPVYCCHALCRNQFTLLTFCASKQEELEKLSREVISSLTTDKPFEPDKKKITYIDNNMNEELRQQIDEWHKTDHHQEIIDTLEKIPETERDYETIGLLARAYNNTNEYVKAVELLESVKEEGKEDALWNFRMGYAQYYLDNNKDALRYFNKVKEIDPDDEDARYFISQCNQEMPFAQRVEDFWNWFVNNEKKLSDMVRPNSQEEADDFMAFIQEGTGLISENINFNIGGDYEFTFSVEGWPDLFILYPYIISRMPESLKAKWKFFPFNKGMDGSFGFRMYGADIDTAQIMVGASYQEKGKDFNITYYEKNLNALSKEESDNAFRIILEQTLGEGVSFKYIDEVEPAANIEEGMIALPELRKYIEETVKAHGHRFFENPKDLYTGYRLTPKESEELRFDVIVGSTCLEAIVADYYNDSTEIFDHINSFGAQAVFIAFPNSGDNDGQDMLNLRHDIEDRISKEILEPMNLGQVIGGATGTDGCYIDLIVYDIYAFIKVVRPLLEQYPKYSFYLSNFRQHAGLTKLTETDAGIVPYNTYK